MQNEQTKTVNLDEGRNAPSLDGSEMDTLVVVSKVKGFIRQRADLNTSSCAIEALTKTVAEQCLKAIENAKSAGRKTVMGRDIIAG
jgi:histone H3/H4